MSVFAASDADRLDARFKVHLVATIFCHGRCHCLIRLSNDILLASLVLYAFQLAASKTHAKFKCAVRFTTKCPLDLCLMPLELPANAPSCCLVSTAHLPSPGRSLNPFPFEGRKEERKKERRKEKKERKKEKKRKEKKRKDREKRNSKPLGLLESSSLFKEIYAQGVSAAPGRAAVQRRSQHPCGAGRAPSSRALGRPTMPIASDYSNVNCKLGLT